MTGPQLKAALKTAGISQTELARRMTLTPRAVRYWVQKGVPVTTVEAVKATLAARPSIYFSREARLEIAELLDTVKGDAAERYATRLRASVGGLVKPIAGRI